jgi:diaminohydroxyphosphoribosylaminopyrimidine deaminase/5-amino-6-(5-phosphoribosylamino)uracil reductase
MSAAATGDLTGSPTGDLTGAPTGDPAGELRRSDTGWMAHALELAALGLNTTDPNPRVGCVLVKGGEVVGEGWHARAGEPHAEVLALRAADGRARGAVAYVTLEPCCHTGRTPPCADALIAAGVARVVCATVDPNPLVAGGGIKRLEAAGIPVTVGVLAAEARAINAGFFSRFERGRPFIRLKMAMSLDARTAPSAGGRAWITDEASRADVQAWRARSSAVLTGAGTVRTDDPRLDVRLDYGPWVRQPLRVVLDTEATCAPGAKIFHDGRALIFSAADAPERAMPVRIERVPRSDGGVDLEAVVERLGSLEINELLVECGPRLAGSFLDADLVDELILYVAPHFLGMDAAPLAALNGLERAGSAGIGSKGAGPGGARAEGSAGTGWEGSAIGGRLRRFEFRDQRLIDHDLRLVLTPTRA